MADALAIHGIEPSLYEQALAEIHEAYEREHPRPAAAADVAEMLKKIVRGHAETMFLVAWRLAPYLKDQLEYFRGHLDELVPTNVGLEVKEHFELARQFQKRFDDERVVEHSLMRTFANVGITEQTAWRIVETHFSK